MVDIQGLDCLKRVIFTKKTSDLLKKHKQVVFEVSTTATKSCVKRAVKKLWAEAKITGISIMNVHGKAKRMTKSRNRLTTVGKMKKAVVSFLEIPDATGVVGAGV